MAHAVVAKTPYAEKNRSPQNPITCEHPSFSTVPELDVLHLDILNVFHRDHLDPAYITLLMTLMTCLPFNYHNSLLEPVPFEIPEYYPASILKHPLDQPKSAIEHSSILIPSLPLDYREKIGEFAPYTRSSPLDYYLTYLRHCSARLFLASQFEGTQRPVVLHPPKALEFTFEGSHPLYFPFVYSVFADLLSIVAPEEYPKQMGALSTLINERYKKNTHSGVIIPGPIFPSLFMSRQNHAYLSLSFEKSPKKTLYLNSSIFAVTSEKLSSVDMPSKFRYKNRAPLKKTKKRSSDKSRYSSPDDLSKHILSIIQYVMFRPMTIPKEYQK